MALGMDRRGTIALCNVLTHVDAVLARARPLLGALPPKCGAITIAGLDIRHQFFFTGAFGNPSEAEEDDWARSIDMANVLLCEPGRVSSYDGRVAKGARTAGAVRCRDCIIAIAGFPDHFWDEALGLALAVNAHQLSLTAAQSIAALSSNRHFARLRCSR